MDVTCERCGTEYEFDETLLSGRGTSVKCTNCGHVFRVYPSVDRTTSNWRIRSRDGQIELIEALKDLQERIAQGELSPDDEISRGNEPWKALGTIAELETFFAASKTATREGAAKGTLLGAATVPSVQSTLPPADPAGPTPVPTVRHSAKPIPQTLEPPPTASTLPPAEPVSPTPAPEPAERQSIPSTSPPQVYYEEDDDIPALPGRRSNKGLWISVGLLALIGVVVAAQWESIAASLGIQPAPEAEASATPPPPQPETQAAPPEEALPEPKPEAKPEPPARPKPAEAAPKATKAAPKPAPEPEPKKAKPAPKPSGAPKARSKATDRRAPSDLAYDEYDQLEAAAARLVDGRPTDLSYTELMSKANSALAGGSLDRARMYYESALEARPGSAEATDGLATVALKSGNPTLAIRYLRAAARRGDPSAYFRMGKIYRSMGQKEQAVSAYYTYLKRQPGGTHAAEARRAIKAIEPYASLPPDPNAPKKPDKPSDSEPPTPEPAAKEEPAKP